MYRKVLEDVLDDANRCQHERDHMPLITDLYTIQVYINYIAQLCQILY